MRLLTGSSCSRQLPFPFAGDLYGALSFEGMRNQSHPVKIGERLLKDYIYRPAEQLFDIENDPNEIVNLAEKPEYQEDLLKCRKMLEDWQRDTADQWLIRDGMSLGVVYNHLENGLPIPDRFDLDVENPGTKDVPLVKKEDGIPSLRPGGGRPG
jgi:N-sulfoglucosamine sulfohydrolase